MKRPSFQTKPRRRGREAVFEQTSGSDCIVHSRGYRYRLVLHCGGERSEKFLSAIMTSLAIHSGLGASQNSRRYFGPPAVPLPRRCYSSGPSSAAGVGGKHRRHLGSPHGARNRLASRPWTRNGWRRRVYSSSDDGPG